MVQNLAVCLQPLRREGYLSGHTSCNTRPRFFRFPEVLSKFNYHFEQARGTEDQTRFHTG